MKFKSRAPSAASKFHTSRFLELGLGEKQGACLRYVSLNSTWEPGDELSWAAEGTGRLAVEGPGGGGLGG